MEALLAAVEAQLGPSWVEVVDHMREANELDAIEERIRAYDIAGAVQGVESAGARFAADVHTAYTDAGKAMAASIDAAKPKRLVTFDGSNDRAVEWAKVNNADLVQGITQQQRETIVQAVSRGLSEGRNPRSVAVEVRDAIGLTPTQESAIASYRRALEAGDFSNALDRQLSHGHSDRTIAAADRNGRALTTQQIDLAVDRYRTNYVNFRAETIARTEGLRALHQGAAEMVQQAIDNGDVESDEIVQEWHNAGGPRVRESHRHVVAADTGEKTKTLDDVWLTGDGNRLRFPGDPEAPVEETANCRCVVSTTLNPSHQAKTTAPAGFSAEHATVREGIPDPDSIRSGTLYRVSMDDLRGKLRALPGGGDDEVRMQSIRNAWDDGKKLPAIRLMMTPNGKYIVDDGRHRLLVAEEQDRDVLVRFSLAQSNDALTGTVSL